MPDWEQITITLPENFADIVAEFIISASSRGVELQDGKSEKETVITAWLSNQEMEQGIGAKIEKFIDRTMPASRARIEYSKIQDSDWSEKWKEFFRPVRAGRHFVIKPGWEPFEPGPDDIVIEIDPGQAFGVGTHASTALMLENMEWFWEHNANDDVFAMDVLDVGTGTGILGIAAARMGAGRVMAIDIDPEAVKTAARNARVNGVSDIISVSATPVEKIRRNFSLVLANIDRNTLMTLAPGLISVLKPGGTLMISGILTTQKEEIADLFGRQGLSVMRSASGSGAGDSGREEWACLVLK